jgi:hypothetical protein
MQVEVIPLETKELIHKFFVPRGEEENFKNLKKSPLFKRLDNFIFWVASQ